MMKSSWNNAVKATLHCLTGCLIGDIVGMSIGMLFGLPQLAVFILAISLAFVFGYTLTMISLTKTGLPVKKALKIALLADTVSIAVMEITANAVVWGTGAMNHGFMVSLVATLGGFVVAFIATVPVNKTLIDKGLGHAKAHEHHNHEMSHH